MRFRVPSVRFRALNPHRSVLVNGLRSQRELCSSRVAHASPKHYPIMACSQLLRFDSDWQGEFSSVDKTLLVSALESGQVLHLPQLAFGIAPGETCVLDPFVADARSRNISLSGDGVHLNGVAGDESVKQSVFNLLSRFQRSARQLVEGLVPEYRKVLRSSATSLRLQDVTLRRRSWRADDSRLHVDAFPSRPTHGERVLRVFSNINQIGGPRVWRVGEPFEDVARRFLPVLSHPVPLSSWLLHAVGVTKLRRSEYDHLMLNLHDAMKSDIHYQENCPQELVAFPAGSTWICYSDQTSHAAMLGQTLLEQTFFLPPEGMVNPLLAPVHVLQRLTGRKLV